MTTTTADKTTDKTAAATIKKLRKEVTELKRKADIWKCRASYLELELDDLRETIALFKEDDRDEDEAVGETE